MYFVKKTVIYIIIILLIFSLYNDFTRGTDFTNETHSLYINDIKVVERKIQPGDTILSVSEQINGSALENLSVEKIINDFYVVNPNTKKYKLNINEYYYFPFYNFD